MSAVTHELRSLGKTFFFLFSVPVGKLGRSLLYQAMEGRDESASESLARHSAGIHFHSVHLPTAQGAPGIDAEGPR